MKLISILVATYNQESLIRETLNNCIAQTAENYEIVISDDCSTDRTWDVICQFEHNKIRAYRHDKNIGEYKNRNFLINAAKGEYVIFIDGEDIIYPFGIEYISYFVRLYPNCGMFVARPWDENVKYPHLVSIDGYAKHQFMGYGMSALNFTHLIFSKKCLGDIGGFDRLDIRFGDSYIQMKIGLLHGAVIIPDGFSWWRRTPGQASEKLLGDLFLFFEEQNKYFPEFIVATNSLTNYEKNIALINYYGNILRYCFKLFFSKSLFKSVKYLKKYDIPLRYFKSIFIRPVRKDVYYNL